MTELLPCPFCGVCNNAKFLDYIQLDSDNWGYFYCCIECGCSAGYGNTHSAALKKWNSRAAVPPESLNTTTIKTLLDLLNPLHETLDKHLLNEGNHGLSFDTEHSVTITGHHESGLTRAVLLLEKLQDAASATNSAPAIRPLFKAAKDDHVFSPSAQGDCMACGHEKDHPVHIDAPHDDTEGAVDDESIFVPGTEIIDRERIIAKYRALPSKEAQFIALCVTQFGAATPQEAPEKRDDNWPKLLRQWANVLDIPSGPFVNEDLRAAADAFEALTTPPTPATGLREQIIEQCARIVDPWPGFPTKDSVDCKLTAEDTAVIAFRIDAAKIIRSLATHTERKKGKQP